ncbi:hypothetical protein AB0D04_04840 [Streptomyces sp. NPDC048483]|uniref:hypothetical protein n=1 Tax=Streptomyces sp. NPDC048483 TaxID=3154927 RepID=UPI00342D4A48
MAMGLSFDDGRQRWVNKSISVVGIAAAGRTTAMIGGYDFDAKGNGGALLDAASGKRLRTYGEELEASECTRRTQDRRVH